MAKIDQVAQQADKDEKRIVKKAVYTKRPRRVTTAEEKIHFEQHQLPRKKYKHFSLTFKEKEAETGNVIAVTERYKYLKEARSIGRDKNRLGTFISLYNNNGVTMPL